MVPGKYKEVFLFGKFDKFIKILKQNLIVRHLNCKKPYVKICKIVYISKCISSGVSSRSCQVGRVFRRSTTEKYLCGTGAEVWGS